MLLRDRYLIDLSTRIPELDQPSAKAYAVEDRRDLTHKIFALACTPGLPARMDAIKAMQGLRYRRILLVCDPVLLLYLIWPFSERR